MKDYQERVVEEKKALDEKIEKLDKFLNFPKDRGINLAEECRMKRQLFFMREYSTVLGERIDDFE